MASRPFPSPAPSGNPGSEPRRAIRIYFVGAHATGKTTLARYVRDRYGLTLISEVARTLLAELEVSLDRLRSNIDLVNRYQLEVFRRQIAAERDAGDAFVSDRAFCNLAYAAHHATVMREMFRDPALEEYMRWVSGGLVFFVRPHADLIQGDNVRTALRYEDVVLIDGMVKLLLEMYAIPYVTIATLSMQERVRLVDELVRLRYPELAAPRGLRSAPAASPGAAPSSPGASPNGPATRLSRSSPVPRAEAPGNGAPPAGLPIIPAADLHPES